MYMRATVPSFHVGCSQKSFDDSLLTPDYFLKRIMWMSYYRSSRFPFISKTRPKNSIDVFLGRRFFISTVLCCLRPDFD